MYLTPWEAWEEDFLREVAGKMSTSEIMEKLERSAKSIQNKASRLRVSLLPEPVRPWTDYERSLINTLPPEQIAEITSRSVFAVRAMRYKLSRG
jgi:hypothetical protein